MKILLFYILFALLSQQTTDNGQQIKSPSHQVSESPSKDDPNNLVTWRPGDSVTYYKYQINLADSLYKNYLPQYNFDEVKAAVDFFEKSPSHQVSESPSRDDSNNSMTWRLGDSATQYLGDSVTQRLGDSNILHAKAHYYHAVGLTERDDIVGACEHYLRALEIMELETENLKTAKSELETENLRTSKSEKRLKTKDKRLKKNLRNLKSQNLQVSGTRRLGDSATQLLSNSVTQQLSNSSYEKIRFLALIYTRLGRLFLNENYCDLAITKYRKALRYVEMIDEKPSKANVLKGLGNSYQLSNKPDSALYYYGESLRYNSSLPNRLDVEKSIAKILFYKGEKDSAYVILKNNLREIDNGNLKYSYHYTIGNMFYVDKKYDSALYYLETSLDNDIVTKKVAFTTKLSAIYDSLGDYDKRDYYDNLSAKMLLNHANKEVDNKQLQVLYDNYKERKNERERSIAKAKTRKQIIAIGLSAFVILASLSIFFKYRHQRHIDKLTEDIDDYANENKQLVEDF